MRSVPEGSDRIGNEMINDFMMSDLCTYPDFTSIDRS